ncbi:sugar phosphate isomerase/epimerase family protein [Demequina sp.]|uniref:sugar phosphate isomerase/epimerase family protein n=1 Tax=Demequina sp. TaxID=2050685 RepID=UPI003D0FAC4E
MTSRERPTFVDTLAAWCVVPYDDRPRTPTQRADALARLGIDALAWDWRDEHVAQFDAQLDALEERGLGLAAIWSPIPDGKLNPHLEAQVRTASGRGLTPQLWACAEFGAPGPVTEEGDAEQFADRIEPLARLAAETGMTLAFYNHLGWAGEPLNQIRILEELVARGYDNTGLAYMQHHGHAHVDGFAAMWGRIQHAVVALGLNGTRDGAHWGDGKVLPYGHGSRDLELARVIHNSGWHGLTAAIGHTMDPMEDRIQDNLDGLDWIARALSANIPEPRWPH